MVPAPRIGHGICLFMFFRWLKFFFVLFNICTNRQTEETPRHTLKRRRAIHSRDAAPYTQEPPNGGPKLISPGRVCGTDTRRYSPRVACPSKERCMQLHGPARSVDLYAIKKQLRALEGPGTRASLNHERATGLPTVPSRSAAQSQFGQIKVQDIYCSPSSDSLR